MVTTIEVISKYDTINGKEYRFDLSQYKSVDNAFETAGFNVYTPDKILLGFIYAAPGSRIWYGKPVSQNRWYAGETMAEVVSAIDCPDSRMKKPEQKFTRFELIGSDA